MWLQEKGNINAQWWANEILNALGHEEENIDAKQLWKKVGMRQMAGILVYIFARAKFHPYIGSMSTSSVGTGIMGFGGNKGAVAVSFTLFRRRVVAVCSHFAAHQVRYAECNADNSPANFAGISIDKNWEAVWLSFQTISTH